MDVQALPAYKNRYEKVDVLNLIDPQWLENSQAQKLIMMVRAAQAGLQDCNSNQPERAQLLMSA